MYWVNQSVSNYLESRPKLKLQYVLRNQFKGRNEGIKVCHWGIVFVPNNHGCPTFWTIQGLELQAVAECADISLIRMQ